MANATLSAPAPADALNPATTFARVYQAFRSKQRDYDLASEASGSYDEENQSMRRDDNERQLGMSEEKARWLEELLDEDTGLAAMWAEGLKDITDAAPPPEEVASPDPILSAVWKQAQTWKLIAGLFNYRMNRPVPSIDAETLLSENPYATPQELIDAICESDEELAEWLIIKDIFLDVSPFSSSSPAQAPILGRGYLPDTTSEIKRQRRLAGGSLTNSTAVKSAVTARSLDLDVDVREEGIRGAGSISMSDKHERGLLLVKLFELIRRGQLPEALELCRACKEPWRAASLLGGSAWKPQAVAKGNDDAMEGMQSTSSGNRNRLLWKKTTKAIARNPALSMHERAIYGALAGDLDSILPLCESWDDRFWAHLVVKIERRIDRRLQSLGGFWLTEFSDAHDADLDKDTDLDGDDLGAIFQRLQRSDNDESGEVEDTYNLIQAGIVTNDVNGLLQRFVGRIEELDVVDEDFSVLFKCFFAHLVLLLRLVGKDVPDELANAILRSYIAVLSQADPELVAIYAAELRSGSAEDEYAKFLKGLDKYASLEERRESFLRAQDHGLDLRAIANKVAQTSIQPITYLTGGLLEEPEYPPPVTASEEQESRDERHLDLIRGLEWLTMVEDSYTDALVAANRFLRYFFAINDVRMARQLLSSLPSNLTEQVSAQFSEMDPVYSQSVELENELLEFKLHAVFSNALSLLERAEQIWSSAVEETANMLKSEKMSWSRKNANVIDVAYNSLLELFLRSGWSTFVPRDTSDRQRSAVFDRVRKVHVPQTIQRLHILLADSSEYLSGNLQRALELSSAVASESTSLYSHFVHDVVDDSTGQIVQSGEELESYLELVREAVMENLRRGTAEPVTVSTS